MSLPTAQFGSFTDGGRMLRGCEFCNEDFVKGGVASATDDALPFDLVGTSAALTIEDNSDNGVGKLVSNSTNPAYLIQNGEPVLLKANRILIFEYYGGLADADGQNFFSGLAITNANVFSGSVTDYIGFFVLTGNASINYGAGKNNDSTPGSGTSTVETDADSGVDFADSSGNGDDFRYLKVIVNGTSSARFFVDGVQVGEITETDGTLPDDEYLTVTWGGVGSAETMYADYLYGYQTR